MVRCRVGLEAHGASETAVVHEVSSGSAVQWRGIERALISMKLGSVPSYASAETGRRQTICRSRLASSHCRAI